MRMIDADATVQYLRRFRCADCDRRKGMKNGKVRFCYEIGDAPCRSCDIGDTIEWFLDEDITPTIPAIPVEWLNQKYAENEPEKNKNFDSYLWDSIGYILTEWQKEQEAQDE